MIQEAREKYNKNEIVFKELEIIFFENATEEQKTSFWNCPVYDRPNIIIGKSQSQMDTEWNALVNCP